MLWLILNGVALIGLFLTIFTFFWSYSSVPDHIPIHYGLSGSADWFVDNKNVLVLYPIIALLGFGSLSWYGSKYPNRMNYLWAITQQYRKIQYYYATIYVKFVSGLLCWMMYFIERESIRVAHKESDGIGIAAVLAILVSFAGSFFCYAYAAWKNK